MAKRSYPSNDFFKHRDGPTRQARLNEWYMNKEGHSEAISYSNLLKMAFLITEITNRCSCPL